MRCNLESLSIGNCQLMRILPGVDDWGLFESSPTNIQLSRNMRALVCSPLATIFVNVIIFTSKLQLTSEMIDLLSEIKNSNFEALLNCLTACSTAKLKCKKISEERNVPGLPAVFDAVKA